MVDGKLHVKELLGVKIGSTESIVALQQLANDVSNIVCSTGNTVAGGSTELPFDLLIPNMNVLIMDNQKGNDKITVKMQDIQVSKSICRISQFEATAFDGIGAQISGMQVSLEDIARISIQVEAVNRLTFQKISCLAAPLVDTTVSIGKDAVDARFKSLRISSIEKLMALPTSKIGPNTSSPSSHRSSMLKKYSASDM